MTFPKIGNQTDKLILKLILNREVGRKTVFQNRKPKEKCRSIINSCECALYPGVTKS